MFEFIYLHAYVFAGCYKQVVFFQLKKIIIVIPGYTSDQNKEKHQEGWWNRGGK